jgi:hypothetical protein
MTQMPQAKAAAAPRADAPAATKKIVQELKVSAHLMTLDPGVFCIFNAPGGPRSDEATGFPGVRVSAPPNTGSGKVVDILSFGTDGWMGGRDAAVLVRIGEEPSEVLITIYQREGAAEPAPKIQIQQLSEGAAAAAISAAEAPPVRTQVTPADLASAEIAAHIQRRGDVVASIGEWMGEKGSQRWIEGFSIAPRSEIGREDIEYQAVLGRGWLSPWSEGGQYCGSRGMALPILGLRVRLKGEAASTHTVRISASFTDGSTAGPVDGSRTCEAESLAPLEAFQVELVPVEADRDALAESSPAGRPASRTGKPAPAPKAAAVTKPTVAPAKAPARGKPAAVSPGRRK